MQSQKPKYPTHSPTRQNPQKNNELSTTYFQHHNSNPISFKANPPKSQQYFHHSNIDYSYGYSYSNSNSCSRGTGAGGGSVSRCKGRDREEYINRNLVFKPEIHEMPDSVYGGRGGRSREEIREKLMLDATKVIQERMRDKAKLEQEELKKCTFHPKISQFTTTQPADNHEKGQIFERLFKQAEEIRQNKILVQKMRIQKQTDQITQLLHHKLHAAKPLLNTQKHNLSPLHTRLTQILQSRLQLHKALQHQHNNPNSLTFTPELSQNTQKIAALKIQREQLKENVVERLMQEYEKSRKRKEKEVEIWRRKEEEECTFYPEVNDYVGGTDGREIGYWRGRDSRLDDEESMYPFMPKIDRLSNLIVMHTRGEQEPQAKIDRLSRQPLQQKQTNIQKLRSEIYQNFTFKPTINPISTQSTPMPHTHRCPQPVPQTYSFHPQINQKSKQIRPQSASLSKIKIKKRQLQYKLECQYQEMKECSFRPRVNNRRHRGDRSLGHVEGIEKFMAGRDKARVLEEELRNREKKVFGFQLSYDQRKNFTNKL